MNKRLAIILLHLFFANQCLLGKEDLNITTYSVDNGLSDNTIYSIFQDKQGFVWAATYNGLNKFDGYQFTVYRPEAYNQHSVCEGITTMFQSSNETVWLGSQSMLQYYDARKDNFASFPFVNKYHTKINIHITSIAEDTKGMLWIGTYNYGLLKFNPKSSKYSIIADSEQGNKYPFPSRKITVMFQQDKYLWIGTEDIGLIRFNTEKMSFIIYSHKQNDSTSLIDNRVRALAWDKTRRCLWIGTNGGLSMISNDSKMHSNIAPQKCNSEPISALSCVGRELYIGTELGGLKVFQPDDQSITIHRYNQNHRSRIPDNYISSLLCDNQNNVWIGTNEGGVAFIPSVKTHFKNYQLFESITEIRQNFVRALYADSQNNIWAGSDGNGLFVLRSGNESFTQHPFSDIHNQTVNSIKEDKKGNLWIATSESGVYVFDKNRKKAKHIDRFTPIGNNLSSNTVNTIMVSNENDVWLGTKNDGIDVWDSKKQHFYSIKNDRSGKSDHQLSSPQITTLLQDSKGNIWIGTSLGLNCYVEGKGIVKRFFHNKNDSLALSNDYITTLFEDKNRNLWVGTKYGLNKYNDVDGGSFINFFTNDSLVDNSIQCIQDDNNGNLWISTNNGVSLFDITQWRFYNYNAIDGLQANRFKTAACKSINGTVYLGGENGITAISPNKLQHNAILPILYFNSFELFNEELRPDDKHQILHQNISLTKSIVLTHNQNMISIGFTAINFINPQKTRFAYKLEGVDRNWILTNSQQRIARYSNLDPGKYRFLLRACNSDHQWTEKAAELKITIMSPFWRTIYFYFALVAFIVGGIVTVIRYREYRSKRERRKLEIQVERRTFELRRKNEELQLLNKTKDKFFTIIAHDLKNPLNALIGFSDLMTSRYDSLDEAQKVRFIGIINNSAKQMYDMLVNLLNWSRSQLGAITVKQSRIKILGNIQGNVALSGQMIDNKNLTVSITIENNCIAWADPMLFDTVIRNLISNAIKFTPNGGKISISAQNITETMIEINITDTGTGMTKEILETLFKVDQYKSQPGTNQEQGTGLGLIVCKEFIEKNGGQLVVESELNKGSSFRFTIPALIIQAN